MYALIRYVCTSFYLVVEGWIRGEGGYGEDVGSGDLGL